MIPLNIDDPTVLRRTLELLEERIPDIAEQVSPINELQVGSDLLTIEAKVNEIVRGFNALVTELGSNKLV